jgi:hypothetical protein
MNIYQILESLQRVEEGAMSEVDQLMQDLGSGEVDAYDIYANPKTPVEQHVSKILNSMYDDVAINHRLHPDDDFEEILEIVTDQIAQDYPSEMSENEFAGQARGQRPGDQWRGTDAGTPGTKLVGEDGMEESYTPKVGDSVRTRNSTATGIMEKVEGNTGYFRSTEGKLYKTNVKNLARGHAVDEAGANNPTTANPAAMAKTLSNTAANLNKLKSAGVNLPVGVSQAAQSAVDTADNPGAVQGQGMDMTDKKTTTALGQEMAQAVAHGNPSQIGTLAQTLKQIEQGQQK